ncbi:AbrB/MazE/SpoVT family DNA-binding domain-containing protein [Paenibacillus flagellatus]|uniref:AbrB family transcriptional regulator n=1 Tax=Paenibacillus flagellatus TaxID=2211139 RepID=A0A2V5KBV6_9BACL|nr:AbrB/MazE/SpoVT family DNA-binding domain-containing protein [Paenibacillus flagellatus]PYI57051.1 AbrB family transcriptional regulator [Paenibacillus flagellatus]
MKATGFVRRVDDLGRIVIPKELRRAFEIEIGDAIEVYTEGERIVLKKYARGCTICGNAEDRELIHLDPDKLICNNCITTVAKLQKRLSL